MGVRDLGMTLSHISSIVIVVPLLLLVVGQEKMVQMLVGEAMNSLQMAFYNGWKSKHGWKHKTVDNAFGLTVDMTRPTSLRRHDVRVLHRSNIIQRMRNLQNGQLIQYIIGGDSAYSKTTHLAFYHEESDGIPGWERGGMVSFHEEGTYGN